MTTALHPGWLCRVAVTGGLVLVLLGCPWTTSDTTTEDQAAVARMANVATPHAAIELAETIADPIYRASAVEAWVEAHRAALSASDARALCDTIKEGSAERCWHIYSAAHLR